MATRLESKRQPILDKLTVLFGEQSAPTVFDRLAELLASYETRPALRSAADRVDERDVILITYGDLLQRGGESPLVTLHNTLNDQLADVVNTVHILPFFPYSSDDGFSVIDYLAVNPDLGTWQDVDAMSRDFKLMFDAVINHISAGSAWFKGFLDGDPTYQDYFITVEPGTDLSDVTRPRTLPLLTPVQTSDGEKLVWTTFSADQIDLNFASANVTLAVVNVLLDYVARGASLIRLDAIAYAWKQIGTNCIHLPELHTLVQLMRDVLDVAAPDVLIITETNVPHDENIAYFGDGANEAQLVYQFSLPPLVLHSFRLGDASALSDWASSLEKVSDTTTYFNFTASHDGIGVRPATGLIPDEDIMALAKLAESKGGQVSYKNNSDGSQSPYELNVTYVNATIDQDAPVNVQADQFLASQAIMLSFVGVPGIYFHSLLGSQNWLEGVAETGRARSINREKLYVDALLPQLGDESTLRYHVFNRYRELIRIRTGQKAFHPNGDQDVLTLNPAVFAIRRTSPDGSNVIIALHNVSGASQQVTLTQDAVNTETQLLADLVGGESFAWAGEMALTLTPYQVMWLKLG